MEFVSALLAIIMIDLLLAGDNALVIGLAARQLPKDQQKKRYSGERSVRSVFAPWQRCWWCGC